MLKIADGIDRAIGLLCRATIIVTGITLTVVMTANVAARYVLSTGGFGFAQELPTLLFPWFIMAGVTLAATRRRTYGRRVALRQAGGTGQGPAVRVGQPFHSAVLCRTCLAVACGCRHSQRRTQPGARSAQLHRLLLHCCRLHSRGLVTLTATMRVLKLGWAARPVSNIEEMPL